MTQTPNVGLPYVPQGTLDPAAGLNIALDVADVMIQTAVISMSLTAPPVSPANGDLYVVAGFGGTATGAWAGQERNIARRVTEGAFWAFYAAGDRVKLVLNLDDGGLYKFLPDTAGGDWVLVAGVSDAPSNGMLFGRRDGDWEAIPSLSIATESSASSGFDDVTTILVGDGIQISEVTPGIVLLEALSHSVILTVSGTSRVAEVTDNNTYARFTNAGTKTYAFDGANDYGIGHEFHGRNVGAGDLTIVAAGGMTINPPAGGSLVVPQNGNFTVKIVATDEADLFGVTEATT